MTGLQISSKTSNQWCIDALKTDTKPLILDIYINLGSSNVIGFQQFKKINEEFSCENCSASVPVASKTCRNHCPFCLHSKHVDILPGDRQNSCKGLLKPTGYHNHSKKGLMIDFICQSCGEKTRNIAIIDDTIQPDDYDQILSLTPCR